ncbi:hypothetical protein [Aurantibacter sp.]|uniref:hypothetical protein n=1 Tax=Aurantibacter sp. TaxID=2807103 RepID=UPI0035C84808
MLLKTDYINTFLILFSITLACFYPFELFLFSYAFLGPLHYLTEINWISNKNFFVKNPTWKYIVFIAAFIYALPYVLGIPQVKPLINDVLYSVLYNYVFKYTNALLLFILILAIFQTFIKKKWTFYIGALITILISVFLFNNTIYNLFLGLFLPTIIHVFVFTILFMWYGIKKNKSKYGLINVVLMFLIPILLCFINTDIFNYKFSEFTKENYISNNFHILNANMSNFLGFYEDLKFFFYEKVDLKIQIFIAFAYTYHYLNWFSKTTVIGWHKNLSIKKTVLMVLVWLIILACYLYSYSLGLIVSLYFSITHVMLELPLNILTFRSLFNKK